MPAPARLITLNLGSQTIGLAEFRVAHGGLTLVNYRCAKCLSIQRPGSVAMHMLRSKRAPPCYAR